MPNMKRMLGSRTALALGAWVAYALGFIPLHRLVGLAVAALAILPVVVMGWLFGMRSALLASLLIFPLNMLLTTLVTGTRWYMMTPQALFGTVLILLIGGVVGRLHDLGEQVKQELIKRKQAEKALYRAHDELEMQVQERTADLARANEALRDEITERKRAEEALRASEERFALAMRGSNDGLYDWDIINNTLYWSPRLKEILGYADDELDVDFDTFETLLHPNDREHTAAAIEAHLKNRELFDVEQRLLAKSGQYVWARARGQAVWDKDGHPLRMVGSTTDITERKRAETEIRRLNQFLDSVINAADVWLDVIDKKGNIVLRNRAAEEISGYSREEVLGHAKIWEWLYPDEEYRNEILARAIARIGTGEEAKDVETTIRRKDGQTRVISWNSRNLVDEEGNSTGSIALGHDITERKRTEKALAEERNLLRTVIDNLPDSIYVKDTESQYSINNAAHLRFLGATTLDEVVGKSVFELFPQELAEQYYADDQKVIQSGQPLLEREERSVDPTGNDVWNLTTKVPLRDSYGKIAGIVGIARDITKRKRTEEALRESEKKYRAILENIEEGYYEVDIAGNFTFFNDSLCRLHGYPENELMGMNNRQYMDAEAAKRVYQTFNTVYRTGKPAEISDWEVIRKDKTRRFVEASVSLIRDSSGEPTGFRGIIRDITERKQAEEALKRRMEQLAALGQASQIVTASLELDQVLAEILSLASEVVASDHTTVVLMDETGQIRRSAENLAGVPAMEYRAREEGLTSLMVRSHQPVVISEIGEDGAISPDLGEGAPRFFNPPIVEAGIKSCAGLPLIVKGRLLGVLYLHSVRPYTFDGQLPLLTTFANQVAIAIENARLFEETERLKVFNESIVQGMEEGIVMEDAEGHITFANPKMAGMLGYTAQDLVGKHWSEIIAPSCLSQVEEESSGRPEGISSRYEAVLLRKDGKEVPGLISATPLFREGKFAGTLAVCTDLTEIKEMEQQLIQSEKLAAIGQLVAGVAHELNNPLTSVVGYSHLLLKAECSEEIKRDLDRINRQALRAARIVENLLTFARRRKPQKESININDVIEKSLDLQAHQLQLDRISIVKELDEALPRTVADPFQMQQVFMNIIGNAHQALRDWEGERQLTVRSKLAGDMIRVEFSDSGPGIPPEVIGRLFEPFFTTREVGQGTGLGLSISYGIVEAHAGKIWAKSEVGKGATFIVEIPTKGH